MTKVLKIDYAPYTLIAKQAPNSKSKQTERAGCLLRFTFKEFGYGYADCHPLEEFGDFSLQKQIKLLKEKTFTNITQRSLFFATIDAQCRTRRESAFEDITEFPKNHFTSPALIKKEDLLEKKDLGFTKFKFKFGKHIPNELNYVENMFSFFKTNQLKMRIDFNGNLKQKSTLEALKPYADIIEFIEDPFSNLEPKTLLTLKEYGEYFNFAMDFVNASDAKILNLFKYRVVKPARENVQKFKTSRNLSLVFTSSMDHPLGQICALYDACKYLKASNKTKDKIDIIENYGLMTQHLFEENPYSNLMPHKNTYLLPPRGFGFGFDTLLRNEEWRSCF